MGMRRKLEVRLFGRLEVRAGTVPIRITGRHSQALMAILALRPRHRLRDAIAADLWPEAGGPSAASLRQALWLLRSSFAAAGLDSDEWLDADQDTLGVAPRAGLDRDADAFERLALSSAAADQDQALRLRRGELLEGLGHECFVADRERFSDLYEDLLATVAERRLADGDTVGATHAASELLGRDPLREEAHAVLIAAYGRSGSRSQVVRQYRRVCTILRSELAVTPLPETDAAYRIALSTTAIRSQERASQLAFETVRFAPILVESA